MHCHACRSAMDAGDRFCASCGAPAQQSICAKCGNPNHRDSAFCTHCRHALGREKTTNCVVAQATHLAEPPPSEKKFVTILRADLVQSTRLIAELEPEQAILRLAPALAAMRAAVRKFGGIVHSEAGDGLSAVFGAPLADDNHAPLAGHAAIELVRRVAGLGDPGLQVRVGLHSGFVVAHMIANEFSNVYELGGPAQALAVRLESAAEPGQIYASEACQTLSEGYIRFDYLGLKPLKGFPNPVPLYRVADASDLSSWRVRKTRNVSPFVGRSNEMASLRQAAEDTLKSGLIVCLFGDAGIGKSRLVHEFIQDLASEGWRVIEAECSPTLQALPFAVLKNLLLSILGPCGAKGQLSDAKGPRTGLPQIWRSALDAVLDLPVSDAQWDTLDPQLRGRAICDASRAIVENVAREQPTVLLIEDLHWVDSASDVAIESFGSLTGRHHLLVLVTSRPNAAPEWLDRCNSKRLWLPPLDDRAGRAMLDAIVGPSASTLDLKSRIIRHTGNVPLFIEEVCRRLRETGVFQGQWGSLVLNGRPELGVPPTIQGVIAARIDRLPKDQRTLLQIAAAIGPRSTVASLRDVAELPEASLQSRLCALDRAELFIEADLAPEHSYEFPHDLVRQVTYESMLEVTREGLHRRILNALESAAHQRSGDQSDTLCHHATRAKDWPKTVAYARRVARKCVARSAFSDATSYVDIAIDALDRTPMSPEREAEAIDLRIEARIAFMGLGRIDRWLDLGKEAEQRAGLIGDAERKIAAMTVRSGALNFYGTPLEAVAAGEEVVREAERSGVLGWLSLAEYNLGQAYFIAGRYRKAERMLDRACTRLMGAAPMAPMAPIATTARALPRVSGAVGDAVRSAGHSLLMCCHMKSVSHTMLGELESAEFFHRQAHRIADESNRPFDRIAAAYGLGALLLGRGDPAAAATVLDGAFALAQQHDVRLFIPLIACQRGKAYLEEGRLEAARQVLADAREAANGPGHKSAWLRASIYLALALCESGDTDSALRMLRNVRNTACQQGFEGHEAEALFSEAKVMTIMPTSETSAIIRCLRASIAIAARNEARPLLVKSEALLGRILAGTGDVESFLQSRESVGSAAARNGAPDARDASAWSSGGTPSIVADTKASPE
jgi:class 3 adenylate cyclase/tetratricopeptide (TPR) repeat protein